MDGNITINIVEPGTPPSPTPIDPVTPNTGLFTSGTNGPEATIITAISAVLILTIVAIVITSLLYRKQKKSGKVTKLVRVVDSTKAVLKSNKHITTAVILLAILTSTGTFIALARNVVNASESDGQSQTEGTNDSSLTVDVSSEELTIEVGDEPVFAVLPVDVKVAESTPAGYTLTSYTETTGLVSTTDDTNIIPMISTDEGELAALKDNTYGLSTVKPDSKDDKIYTILSTAADNPTFITDKDYKATEANDTTTIYYGFYITPDTPYGTYTSSDIYYNATTNSSKVIFNGNGLYFNNNPEQTTNDVEYITGITSNTTKYSHTPNINDEGIADGALSYNTQTNNVVAIPGAATLHIVYTYGGGRQYGSAWGYGSFWEGSHPDYTPDNNYSSGIQNCGGGTITDGKYYSDNNTQFTVECDISGDTATFGYWTSGGGPGSTATSYGYYAVVTGYDADGNIIYLPGNTQVGGEYKDPAQDLPYVFLGWNKSSESTTPEYVTEDDIKSGLALTLGETTTLYAVWQKATTITYDGNGADSGTMDTQTIIAGESDSLYENAFVKDGYSFNGWNTKADGTGTSYPDQGTYIAPVSESQDITLYAQWKELLKMQDVANWGNTLQIGDEITAVDKRDGQEYTVARLADNKIWMTKNLNLAGGTEITSELSNVPNDYTLPTANGFQSGNKLPISSTSGFNDDTKAFVYNSTKTSGTDCSSPGCYSYYSWTAATAGSGLSITADNTDAPYSICPKGWKLPSTRTTDVADWKTESDFYKLAVAYGMDPSETFQSTSNFYNQAGPGTTPNFLLTGYHYADGSFYNGGSYGYYWSSTSFDNNGARHLSFRSSNVSSASRSSRRDGYAVRCIAE